VAAPSKSCAFGFFYQLKEREPYPHETISVGQFFLLSLYLDRIESINRQRTNAKRKPLRKFRQVHLF
jgi:hypothetical protein